MPTYRGIFRTGRKGKKLLECFADTQEKANLEFNEYADKEGLVFIRSYVNNSNDYPEEIKKPTVAECRKVIELIKDGKKLNYVRQERVAEYMEGIGQLIKTKNGYTLG